MTEIPDLSLPINNSSRTNVKWRQERRKLRNTERPFFFFFFSSFFSLFSRSSVVRTARLKGPFSCSAKYFNVVLCPGEDVARRCSAVAGGQVVDLGDGKFPVPDVEVRQLTDIGLRRVESSTQCILPKQHGRKGQSSVLQKVQIGFFEKKIKKNLAPLLDRRKN